MRFWTPVLALIFALPVGVCRFPFRQWGGRVAEVGPGSQARGGLQAEAPPADGRVWRPEGGSEALARGQGSLVLRGRGPV